MTKIELELYEQLVKLLGKEDALRAMIMRGYFDQQTLDEIRIELDTREKRLDEKEKKLDILADALIKASTRLKDNGDEW